jgi:DNA-binding NarL/FixJ family response regulator
MPLRVIIADDHPIVLDGLAQLFSAERDLELVQRCTNGNEALAAVRRERPDVLVLDVRMAGRSGLEVLRALAEEKSPTRVVLFSGQMSEAEVVAALRLGAAGIVLKESAPRMLLQCVRTVAAGDPWINPAAAHPARPKPAWSEDPSKALTRRELDIVRMVAVGARNKKIAEQLGISEGTVKMHLHTIYEKLEISGRVELSIYAREHALV